MNVVVISGLYPSTADPLSGIFVQAQVQELVKQGCQVKVVSPKPLAPFPIHLLSRKWARWHNIPDFAKVGGIEVCYPRYLSLPRNWSFCGSGKRMFASIQGLVRKIAREMPVDLIQAHVALPDGYAALRVAEAIQKPLVVTIHGADLQNTLHLGQNCVEAVGEVISGSKAVILVSTKLKRVAEQFFGSSEKLQVIPNGINPDHFRSDLLEERPGKKDQLILLSVSNLIPTKGIDLNLYALKKLLEKYPDLRYRVIGDGPERQNLERLSRKLGLSSQVEFLGQLPREQVMESMAECDIFSLPSWQEGFGIVYLEAMAQGKPVIGCRGEGIEDFVRDGETGFLIQPKDLDGLALALDYLLDNPRKRIEVGQGARKLVLENYTWETNARRTIQLYREIINAD